MVSLHWSESLELGFVPMDDLHRQLVVQMAVVEDCPDSALATEWSGWWHAPKPCLPKKMAG